MLDGGHDQAAGLRRLAAAGPRLIALALDAQDDERWVARLASGLRSAGSRPVVLDASRGRVAQAFGLRPRHELLDLLQGSHTFDAVAQCSGEGIHVLRAERGVEAFVASGEPPQQLFGALARLSHGFDAIVLAMPAHELACLANPAQAVPVLALPADAQGLPAAYALLKDLAGRFGYTRFAAVGRPGARHSHRDLHARLAQTAWRFLGVHVLLAGCLPAAAAEPGDALPETAQSILQAAATPLALH